MNRVKGPMTNLLKMISRFENIISFLGRTGSKMQNSIKGKITAVESRAEHRTWEEWRWKPPPIRDCLRNLRQPHRWPRDSYKARLLILISAPKIPLLMIIAAEKNLHVMMLRALLLVAALQYSLAAPEENAFLHQYRESPHLHDDPTPMETTSGKPFFNRNFLSVKASSADSFPVMGKKKNDKKHFGRKFKYDPALMLMGLGKRKLHKTMEYWNLSEKTLDPVLKYIALGKGNYSSGRSKRSTKAQPLMRVKEIRKSVTTFNVQNHSDTSIVDDEDLKDNVINLNHGNQLTYLNEEPLIKLDETGMEYFNNEPSTAYEQAEQINNSNKAQLKDVSDKKNIKREFKYDPNMRYMGLGKKDSGYDPMLRYMGLGKRYNFDPALKYMGLGKRSSNYDPALKYMGLGKRSSNYDPA
ncbi:uncharacterized protein NPIL_178041, partial [Nephila pilipes]